MISQGGESSGQGQQSEAGCVPGMMWTFFFGGAGRGQKVDELTWKKIGGCREKRLAASTAGAQRQRLEHCFYATDDACKISKTDVVKSGRSKC